MTGGVVMLTIKEATCCSRPVNFPGNSLALRIPHKVAIAYSSDTSDEVLVEAISRGERRAMELLYKRHSVRVYRFAVRLAGSSAAAEDIVSEVFLDVWRKASGFKAKSLVSTWLLAITRNKSLSAARHRVEDQLHDHDAADIADLSDDPETLVDRTDRSAIIQKCLSKLSAAQREVIDLVYYHEKSVEQVARIVGAPPSTVKTRMFYARRRMEELLKVAGLSGA
jgi:RNA polymerase sigma-70 factor, ECF subfamily